VYHHHRVHSFLVEILGSVALDGACTFYFVVAEAAFDDGFVWFAEIEAEISKGSVYQSH
jgi:hypothetical protein